jgi:hypothetical protein
LANQFGNLFTTDPLWLCHLVSFRLRRADGAALTIKLSDRRPTETLAEASDLRITETVVTAKRGGGSLQRPC